MKESLGVYKMRKENRIVISYLKSMKNQINYLIKELESCELNQIDNILQDSFKRFDDDKMSNKIERFIHKLATKSNTK